MIKYTLKCARDHRFDSWFASADAFDRLKAAGHVSCAVCGGSEVDKAIMAPQVRPARRADDQNSARMADDQNSARMADDQNSARMADDPRGALTAPASAAEQALQHMRKTIEENSEYVGKNFVTEARAMYTGDAPERPIYGEATLKDAKSLIDDGVPIAPLPFGPKRKAN